GHVGAQAPAALVVVPANTLAPRGVTDGCSARKQEPTRSSSVRGDDDAAECRRGLLECERICGGGHKWSPPGLPTEAVGQAEMHATVCSLAGWCSSPISRSATARTPVQTANRVHLDPPRQKPAPTHQLVT